MQPSTPPPPKREVLAALTIASTRIFVMSFLIICNGMKHTSHSSDQSPCLFCFHFFQNLLLCCTEVQSFLRHQNVTRRSTNDSILFFTVLEPFLKTSNSCNHLFLNITVRQVLPQLSVSIISYISKFCL